MIELGHALRVGAGSHGAPDPYACRARASAAKTATQRKRVCILE